jgi:selenocysteine lyase/cysteine desulfurase
LNQNKEKLLAYIGDNLIGSHKTTSLKTVFGQKPHVYLDFTASGKALTFIEDYLQKTIMPMYANTHSMQSASGKQTIFARDEARHAIKQYINATENDALIFTGSGATSASNLLINKLKIKEICTNVQLRKRLAEAFEGDMAKVDQAMGLQEQERNYCK